jgi:hypothetical protein
MMTGRAGPTLEILLGILSLRFIPHAPLWYSGGNALRASMEPWPTP